MKVKGYLPALALLAAWWAGLLPKSREIESLQLITALAVDGREQVTATALTAVRVGEGEEPRRFTGAGEDLAVACRALRESSARTAYLGQTAQLLVGEEADLGKTLAFVLDNRELRLDTLLYIVRGNAGEGLTASADKVAGETGGADPRGVTVGEALARLSLGEPVALPALSRGEDGLAPDGWAAVGPKGVLGYLEGDAALGCEILSGVELSPVIPLPGGAAEITRAKIRASGGVLCCTLTARVAQGRPDPTALERWGERVLRAALAPGWDCWGLGEDGSRLTMEVTGRMVDRDGM